MSRWNDFLGVNSPGYVIKKRAEDNLLFWRLIFGGISYADAQSMDMEEILEANAALDMLIPKVKGRQKNGPA